MDALERIFGVRKPVIAMLHLPGLPGRPRHDSRAGMAGVCRRRRPRPRALQAAGVDGVLFCNEADLPYQLRSDPRSRRRWRRSSAQLRGELRVPFGVNLLWDPIASLAVARATGARFIREVLTGVYESDLGMIAPDDRRDRRLPDCDRRRRRRPVRQHRARVRERDRPAGASPSGPAAPPSSGSTRILISGPAAGVPFEMTDLRAAKEAVPDRPCSPTPACGPRRSPRSSGSPTARSSARA